MNHQPIIVTILLIIIIIYRQKRIPWRFSSAQAEVCGGTLSRVRRKQLKKGGRHPLLFLSSITHSLALYSLVFLILWWCVIITVQQFLQDKFPELRGRIAGANFPAPPLAELAQRILQYCQLVGMAWMIVGGETLFGFLGYGGTSGRPLPQLYWTIQQYGFQIAMILFFVLPQIINSFFITGAFEIYLDDEEIYSKLKTGTMPTTNVLVDALQKAGLAGKTE